MDRRSFLAKAGLVATWAGVTITISACSSDSDDGLSSGTGDSTDVTGVVRGSHTHGGATVTEAQLLAGVALVLTLTGSGHTHTVGLTEQDVMDIAGGDPVVKTSSNDDGHTHTVTFN